MPWQAWVGLDCALVAVALAALAVIALRLWRQLRRTSGAIRSAADSLQSAADALRGGLDSLGSPAGRLEIDRPAGARPVVGQRSRR